MTGCLHADQASPLRSPVTNPTHFLPAWRPPSTLTRQACTARGTRSWQWASRRVMLTTRSALPATSTCTCLQARVHSNAAAGARRCRCCLLCTRGGQWHRVNLVQCSS